MALELEFCRYEATGRRLFTELLGFLCSQLASKYRVHLLVNECKFNSKAYSYHKTSDFTLRDFPLSFQAKRYALKLGKINDLVYVNG